MNPLNIVGIIGWTIFVFGLLSVKRCEYLLQQINVFTFFLLATFCVFFCQVLSVTLKNSIVVLLKYTHFFNIFKYIFNCKLKKENDNLILSSSTLTLYLAK